jgi:hypothetical protein
MYRKLELDEVTFERSNTALAKALQGGRHLTRDELRDVLQNAGIDSKDGMRMSYLMMFAELEGIVCSGARRGKQFTYALLEERAPQARTLEREEALSELARRYFLSRGPATVQDFAKWSGLSAADAKGGLEAVRGGLLREEVDGQTYWFLRPRTPVNITSPSAHLLSVYDEYISGYRDRSAINGNNLAALFAEFGNALQYVIILDGQLLGTWKRILKKDTTILRLNPLIELSQRESGALADAAERYGNFLELPVELEM